MAEGSLVAGAVIGGRYMLRSKLGGGGFGVAWRATDMGGGRDVAVKVFQPSVTLSDADRGHAAARFAAEVEFLERLEHRNIVRPIGFSTEGGVHCLITELVQGATLADAMIARASERQEIRLDEVMAVIAPLADAVSHANARGVVHRDLKPRNVMLFDAGGRLDIRVLDFGVARLLATKEADATTVGRLIGTMLYMSPEQFTTPHVTASSDQFALATMLYEMLTLRWAWARDELGEPLPVEVSLKSSEANGYGAVLHRICVGERPEVTRYRPDLPTAIDEVLHRAWSRAPADRYESALDLLAAVREALMPLVHDRTQVDEPKTALTLMRSALTVAEPVLEPTPVMQGLRFEATEEPAPPTAILLPPAPKPVPVWFGPAMAAAVALATTTVGLTIVSAVRSREPARLLAVSSSPAAVQPVARRSTPETPAPAATAYPAATPSSRPSPSPSLEAPRSRPPERPKPVEAAPAVAPPSPTVAPRIARAVALGTALVRSDDVLATNPNLVEFLGAAEDAAADVPEPLRLKLRTLVAAAEQDATAGRRDGIMAVLAFLSSVSGAR